MGGSKTRQEKVDLMTEKPERYVKMRKAPLVLSTLFLVLFLAGIAVQEPGRVLEQALQVCLSCIGIG